MRKIGLLCALLLCWAIPAFAQSNPGFYNGQVPTATQLNNDFAGKQDYIPSVNPGYIWAGPCGGATNSAPTFRALCSSDVPGTLGQTNLPNTWQQTQTFQGSIVVPVRVITSGSGVTVSATTDHTICVNKSVGSATAVSLPASPVAGLLFTVKDCKGDAATNNITVTPAAGLIDGASSFVMNQNYQSATFQYNGTGWMVN